MTGISLPEAGTGDAAPIATQPARSFPAGRHAGIDAMRYLLCLPIMIIHTTAVPGVAWWPWAMGACNGAVPAFFMISGYVQAARTGRESPLLPQFVRLMTIYLIWFALYNLPAAILSGGRIGLGVRSLITGGAGFHLWFLPALALSLPLVSLGCRRPGVVATCLLCVALAVAAELWPNLPARRMLHAPLYVLTGRMWARHAPSVSLGAAAAAFLLLWLGVGSLVHALSGTIAGWVIEALQVYALGIAAFAIGVALPATAIVRLLARLGIVSLGIYSMHLWLLAHTLPSLSNASFAVVFGRALLVLACASVLSFVLATLPGTWRMVANRRVRLRGRSSGSGVTI